MNDKNKEEIKKLCVKNEKEYLIPICVDFDATLTDANLYPYIGNENPYAFDIMKKWEKEYNVGWILDTMRGGEIRQEAIDFCEKRGIKFYAIGKHPEQNEWTDSNKAYGIFSIDDRNVGVPLKVNKEGFASVDWKEIERLLEPTLIKIRDYCQTQIRA